jgi:ribosome-binding factor A
MKNASQNGPSQRQLRVGEQLRHIIAETLQRGDFYNENLRSGSHELTVTEVRPSPDLKQATAYVVGLGNEQNTGDLIDALNEEAPVIQKIINKQSNLKFTPRLRFKYDNSFDNAQKLDRLLGNITYSDQE